MSSLLDEQNKLQQEATAVIAQLDLDKTLNKYGQLINDKMTEEKRLVILQLKSHLCANTLYQKVFSSVDIYEAVLLHGVRDKVGLGEYLSKFGKMISI
ncbi:hypothetical protein KA012_00740 [Candidatus Woesebacteria bacterium]|nr:hypothetical protein [Candidatus Woesebacteria bacterium]